MGGRTAARVGWEVIVGVTVHDGISDLRQKGVGGRNLRHKLRARFRAIYCEERNDDSELGGTVGFEFKRCYKTPRASHVTTLVHLRF